MHDKADGIYIDKETSFKVQRESQRQVGRAGRDTPIEELFHNYHMNKGLFSVSGSGPRVPPISWAAVCACVGPLGGVSARGLGRAA